MSFFSGYSFFVYLALALLPAALLGVLEKPLRGYRTVLNVLFIWLIYRDTPRQLLYLLIYAVGSACLVRVYLTLRQKYGRNSRIYGCAVLLALAPLLVFKLGEAVGQNWFGFLGLSYIFFRVVQTVIEIYDGVIQQVNVYHFLNFLLFFPSLSSGPIDRSRRFLADDGQIYPRAEYLDLLQQGFFKLVLGLFYKVVCSALFYGLLSRITGRHEPLYLLAYAYVYGFYMFFDFAGYSAMAVGASYILGIRMPDNFRMPFISVDMKDFWSRWHITLSSWFRDFIFTRFIMQSVRKKWFKDRLTGAAAGLLLNMTIMGVWHGTAAHYIAYGVYHGVLMAATEIYQKKSGFYKANRQKRWYKLLSWFVTLNLVMFGFLIFSGYLGAPAA